MASIAAGRCPGGQLGLTWWILMSVLIFGCIGSSLGAPSVSYINPRVGSLRGATKIEIFGSEFSQDRFSFGQGNEDKGNKVYFFNGTTSIQCDVVDYSSNGDKIVCETRTGSAGTFDLFLEIDGVPLKDIPGASYCNNPDHCRFTYTSGRTPTISSVTPTYNVPEQPLTIYGKIFTDLYEATQLNEQEDDAEDLDDDAEIIERIYWGPQIICDPEDPATESPYGIELDDEDSDWGYIMCRPQGPLVGSYRLQFIVSGLYGRSLSDTDTLYVSGEHKLYHYQTHADIASISPTQGSVAGGTDVVIEGSYFDYTDPDLAVYIGGVPCTIQNVSSTEILCRTNPADDNILHPNATVFPGSRGLTREVWNETSGDVRDDSLFNTSAADFCTHVVPVASSPDNRPCGEHDHYVSRFRGFFVPPDDGEYSLGIQSDDNSVLYFSQTRYPADMVEIASSPSYSNSFERFPEQVSEKMQLEGGKYYYIESRVRDYTAGDNMYLGAFFYNTSIVASQYDGARSEEQTITITSDVRNEFQSITYGSSLYETQDVRVRYGCFGMFCDGDDEFTMTTMTVVNVTMDVNATTPETTTMSMTTENSTEGSGSGFLGYFSLSYGAYSTYDLEVGASAQEVEDALNMLPLGNGSNSNVTYGNLSVTVTTFEEGDITVYRVVFNSYGNFSLLEGETDDSNIRVNVSRVATGVVNGTAPASFRLSYGGRVSDSLSFSSSADDVRDAILDMITVQCQRTSSGNPYYHVDYESAAVGSEYGTRVYDQEPFCGRTSLRNPTWVFFVGTMGSVSSVDLRYTNKFCFAFRGTGFEKYVYIWVSWYDKSRESRYNAMYIPLSVSYSENNWQHYCVDMFEVLSESWLIDDYLSGTQILLERIRMYPKTDQNFWVDNIYLGNKEDSYGTRVPAARPNDNFILDASVVDAANGFTVELQPAQCGYDFPLIGVFGSTVNAGSREEGSDFVTFSSSLWEDGASMKVESVQRSTPPVFGTFNLAQEGGGTVNGLSGQSTADQMKDALEAFLDAGDLSVTRSGECTGYSYNVKWISKGGSQGLLQVTHNGLYNNVTEVNVTTARVHEGGVFLENIPGEFLRTVNDIPQVEVIVNGIPSSCRSGSCSYTYAPAVTPSLTSITPTSGSANAGTTVVITGTSFSDVASENNVTIGGAACMIVDANATRIECDVGEAQGGVYNVSVIVEGVGSASLPAGGVEFEYTFDVDTVSPEEGSSAGGTEVTISGYGLGGDQDVVVYIGSNECVIVTASYDEIVCVIVVESSSRRRRRSTTDADVVVTIDGVDAVTVSNGFTFDSSLTPTVTDIDPEYSSIVGGGDLTISGSSFGSSGAVVMIGSEPCEVTSQDGSSIVCVLPPHVPGDYELDVNIDGVGLADTSAISAFSYVLDVTGMFPDSGSLQGGTEVTLTGAGFGTDTENITVTMGGFECEVTAVEDEELTCTVMSASVNHAVDNMGKHAQFGRGYKWDPQLVQIVAGDSVTWSWNVDPYVSGIGYAVQQTADGDSVGYDGTGFYSGGRSTSSGSYTYQFDVPGIYYYSSGAVRSDGTLFMKGVVEVAQPATIAGQLDVVLAGISAQHDVNSGASDPTSSSCSNEDAAISGCSTNSPNITDDTKFNFIFDECMTPTVSTVDPLVGDSSDTIVIEGVGFSDQDCANIITVGEYPCVTKSSSSTRVECEIDTKDEMEIGVYHEININVANRGFAMHESLILANRSFVMYPRVDSVSDTDGSVEGGLTLIIQGDGFAPSSVSNIGVYIGSLSCGITFFNYTYIECVTPTSSSYSTQSVRVQVNSLWAVGFNNFTYSEAETPSITAWTPSTVSGSGLTSMNFTGSRLSSVADDITITLGGEPCTITAAGTTEIECDVGPVPVGTRDVIVNIAGKGLAMFVNANTTIGSQANIFSVSPSEGSTMGGQLVNISGNGFVDGATTVTIDGTSCSIQSTSLSLIQCITPAMSAGTYDLVVTSDGVAYDAEDYIYSSSATPTVTSISPSSGDIGVSIAISGSAFSDNADDITITIDGVECSITSAAEDQVDCDVGAHSAGVFVVMMHVNGLGDADNTETFEYELTVSSTSPSSGSFGGGQTLVIEGSGFDSETTVVTVCDNMCDIYSVNETTVECDMPANSDSSSTLDCDIVVSLPSGSQVNQTDAYQYRRDMTPVIDSVFPARGGTGGGTTLTIIGEDFLDSGNEVTIAGTTCSIISENSTVIICQTGSHSPSERTQVRVTVGSNGIATQDNADFFYIDVWSSIYTWGGNDPPVEGDFVIIPARQTILLDVTTPILSVLLIQGGEMIFDEADIELHAEYVVVVDGGHFEIGTEEEPFQHEASVVMHGHVRSTELPLFGAKTFAVRNGTVDMHGIPTPITWSRLAETVEAGDTELTLMDSVVNWRIGDHIVLASTGTRHKQTENEEVEITGFSNDNMTIEFTPAVEYDHVSYSQIIDGVLVETRGEVGLLTHNVKIRGSVHEEWLEDVEACPDEFDTNQFATQTCFQGRFGAETETDQFGSQIMFFAKEQDAHLVRGRFEYVEVTHAGQAFRLGRYPIHYHMNGNITGSYVRGCGIHHTFNRAVTIHGVHHLLVEHNVAFNIMGHAFFLEDGIETKNIIQYNLAVFVRPSSSLLNVDVTPASFWVTNPDNYIRHNAAAGGSHFGFWYNMPAHPGGPSFTTSVCPRNVQVQEFYNNTAHTMGWYGIWIFPTYFPTVDGSCGGTPGHTEFHNLTAWRTERGAEGVLVGPIQFHNFLMTDNEASGIEFQTVGSVWGDDGPMIKDSVIIGHTPDLAEGQASDRCTSAGIHLPKSKFLTTDGVKFINFDEDRCVALRACAHCKVFQGGFQHRFMNLEFVDSPNKAAFQWEHETWFEDLDGTLTGDANYIVTPSNRGLPTDHCSFDVDEFSKGFEGAVCDESVLLHRLAFNEALPSSLKYKNAILTNSHGTTTVPFRKKRLTHPDGWMATVVETETYNFFFENVDHVTNISYSARFDEFGDGDYVIMNHNFTQSPDAFALIGDVTENVGRPLEYSEDNHADWYFNNQTNNLYYMISGKGQNNLVNRNVNLDVYRCYYKDCIPPVPDAPPAPPNGRPDNVTYWSDAAAWEDVTEGWGGNTDSGSLVPEDGDDVMIYPNRWIVANSTLPWMNKLFIYGTLEIDDSQDMVINATYILIQGGRLIAGFNETRPFESELRIILNGHHFTQDIPLPNGPNLGSKALGVFGTLDLHGIPRDVTWTQLATTVEAGDSEFTVMVDTDWVVGDEIVVTATSYEAWHTETFRISSRTDSRTFGINGTFANMHAVETAEVNGISYTIAAEVGLLTRNIVIEGSDYDLFFEESFGARTIVGRFIQDGEFYTGSGHIANVEFKHTGQEGWTDFYDPRYSLSFLDVGDVLEEAVPSYVKKCSFHNGFSPAIGVFGTDNIEVDNNVIHHTVGAGIVTYATNTQITNNLVTLMVFPGTYQDRFEGENIDWMGGIDVAQASNPVLINNTVAGSERVGFSIKGELCTDPDVWSNNVAHSCYHGVQILKTGIDPCTKVRDFFSYRNFDYGLYALTPSSLEIKDSIFADNTAGILVHDYGPSALSHVRADKHVLVEDSLMVGYTDSFDCDLDKVTPEGHSQSSKQRPTKSPSGGAVGVYFTSFKGSSGGAPFKPFTSVMSYPAIGGKMILRDVTFSSFNNKCSSGDKLIMTSPQSGDAMHPIDVEGLTIIDTPTDNYVWIHRPPLGLVNPSDCVDMDCDAHKKAFIRDLDGSLMGEAGSVIPDSAFEWGGDPRRGLGDYRIPKMMLTTPDGARIPKDDVAPNNGIIRNDNCGWNARWQAWECHDLDHMMMIIESMDADTEVRRVSPVALHADGYVDLINGPQDHGWCLGYTCQERISTFYTVVATNKNYEMYFTGTNPQSLRFHLLNANTTQALTVGIWYANPQRLDVYANGLYVLPNNGEYVNGALQWIAPSPGNDFMPSLDSQVLGENYFDRELQMLYILVRGSRYVEIRTTPVVITTFGVPAVEVDNFFEENLVENLANLLNIDSSQIRVVEIISEASRKKRSTASSDSEVVVEIGANPAASVSTDEGSSGTTSAPATQAPAELSFDDLTDVQAILADEMQTGNLANSLDITINSMTMTDPVDTPKDPTGGVRATNTTGGPANGTMTYAEVQAEAEELALETAGQPVSYVVASSMVLEVQPGDAIEESAFGIQPRIKVFDSQGNRIEQLGTTTNPWQVTATIVSATSSGTVGFMSDNQTISFNGGWANFTELGVNISATDLILQFTITYPNTSSLTVTSEAFDVDIQPYEVEVITSPSSDVMEDEVFEVIVELRETQTGNVPANLADKGFDSWPVTIAISDPTNYRGELQGTATATLDLSTARASFSLSINEASYYYILSVSVVTSPSSAYHASGTVDPFNVVSTDDLTHSGETASLTIRFDYDYASIAQGNEELIAANFLNHIAPDYNASFSNVGVSQGSILISFDMTSSDVASIQSLIWEDILDGDLTMTFNGQTLVADEYLMVDGAPYEPTSSSSGLPIWIIIVVVVVVLVLVLLIVGAVFMIKKNQNGKITQMDEMPLAVTSEYHGNSKMQVMSYEGSQNSLIHPSLAPTVHIDRTPTPDEGMVNKHLLIDDETDSQRSTLSARSRSPGLHLARRSPEVATSALPPGFLDGQVETELADRVRLFIMVKNSDGTFQKLGEVAANMVGTISQLRHDLKDTALPHKVRDKPFVILKETLAEIQPADEKKLMVNEVYSSDCVLLKWLEDQDITQLCMCGMVGQFHCSLCQKQAYCSPQCQSTDWPRHSFKCSQWATE